VPDSATESRSYESPLRAKQRERTRERILDATTELLAQEGLEELTIPLVARKAGVSGIGFGLTMASLQASAVEAVPPEQAGVAAGLFSTSRYLGSIVGSIVLAALLTSTGAEVSGFRALAVVLVAAAFLAALVSLGLHGRPAPRPAGAVAPAR
jgi:MFS family permease